MSDVDDLTASLATIADGRAALGVTTLWFQKGYARAQALPVGVATGSRTVYDWILSTPNTQSAAHDLLDQANSYAQQVYGELQQQRDSDPIGDLLRRKVGACFAQAESAFNLIDAQAPDGNSSLFSEWLGAVKQVIVGVATGVEYVTKTVAQAAANAVSPLVGGIVLPIVALLAAGGVAYLLLRKAV